MARAPQGKLASLTTTQPRNTTQPQLAMMRFCPSSCRTKTPGAISFTWLDWPVTNTRTSIDRKTPAITARFMVELYHDCSGANVLHLPDIRRRSRTPSPPGPGPLPHRVTGLYYRFEIYCPVFCVPKGLPQTKDLRMSAIAINPVHRVVRFYEAPIGKKAIMAFFPMGAS